MSVPAIAAP
jgi:hypothetical protein